MNIIKQIEVMDAQKVDAFIMANGKFFPDYQVAAIRDMLLAADDSKWSMLQVMQFKDPVEEIKGEAYEPWFTPVIESLTGSELPGEIESLIFCVQTGIGVGVIAFLMGRFYERKKWEDKEEEKK